MKLLVEKRLKDGVYQTPAGPGVAYMLLRPLKTVLAAALLLVSASSKPHMAQNQTPATDKTETKSQGRVLGIGGVFFKAADHAKTREWYAKHLGLVDRGQGVMLPWREHDDPQKETTLWMVSMQCSSVYKKRA